MQKICNKYASICKYMHNICTNMQLRNMQEYAQICIKYATNMQQICKKYATSVNIELQWEYARNMHKICKNMQYMQSWFKYAEYAVQYAGYAIKYV